MKKILKMKNDSKGFTLIELLAVIVILGILMITVIPAVTKYINSSKKSTFADSAGAYINAARYSLLNDEYDCQTPAEAGQTVYIPLYDGNNVNIDIDKGTGKSSYGKNYDTNSYVVVAYSGGKLVYSICLVDDGSNGTNKTSDDSSTCVVEEKDLGKSTIAAQKATKPTAQALSSKTICKKNK